MYKCSLKVDCRSKVRIGMGGLRVFLLTNRIEYGGLFEFLLTKVGKRGWKMVFPPC